MGRDFIGSPLRAPVGSVVGGGARRKRSCGPRHDCPRKPDPVPEEDRGPVVTRGSQGQADKRYREGATGAGFP